VGLGEEGWVLGVDDGMGMGMGSGRKSVGLALRLHPVPQTAPSSEVPRLLAGLQPVCRYF